MSGEQQGTKLASPIARKRIRHTLTLGSLRIRWGWHGVASWGYPMFDYRGLSFLSRHSNGDMGLAAYHPRRSTTWIWSLALTRRPHGWKSWQFAQRSKRRTAQWHDYYRLPFGRTLVIGRQNYHRDCPVTRA